MTADDQRARDEARAAIHGLWDQLSGSFHEQVAVLEEAVVAVLSGVLGPEIAGRALREAHKLAGSLGTFGMPRGSELAREAEGWFAAPPTDDATALLRLADAVAGIRACVETGPVAPPSPVAVSPGRGSPVLLVVDDDRAAREDLAREAAQHGWEVAAVDDAGGARAVLAERPVAVVLIDITGDRSAPAYALMTELQGTDPSPPVVVLSHGDDLIDRVEAAGAGGLGFLKKPVPAAAVLAVVSEVLQRNRTADVKVLACDDDVAILDALEVLLAQDGRQVTTLGTPERFWEALTATDPDLLILDVDMPQIDGIEICRALRADPRWARLPVLFLTARTDADTVEEIFRSGADDYIAKPLVGPELLTRIGNRLERARLLQHLAEVDPLTGLANQRTSAGAMERLLDRGARHDQPVALAVIDIDGVRALNHTVGHQGVDDALRFVGHLLRRAFVGDDVVGRWGGQEFVVAMYAMTRSDGVARLAAVLEELRSHRFDDGTGGTFTVSFSAGVVQAPADGADLTALQGRADAAAQEAKAVGGDRVQAVGWAAGDDSLTDVVLVEDDDALAGILLHGLATRGYRTHRFDDGADAAAALEGPTPSLAARVVLLDWGLPGLDGLRVLRRLADTGALARTRVIMLTARDSESEVLQALDLGAFDHVAKPFSVPVLMQRVRRAMER